MKNFKIELSEDEVITLRLALKQYKESGIHEHAIEKVDNLLKKLKL